MSRASEPEEGLPIPLQAQRAPGCLSSPLLTLMNPQFRKGWLQTSPSCLPLLLHPRELGPGTRHVQPEARLPHRDMELPEEYQGSQGWQGLAPKRVPFLQQGARECGVDHDSLAALS